MATTQGYDPGFVGAAYEAPNYLQDTQRCINYYPEISPDPHAKEVIGLLGAPGTLDLVALQTGKQARPGGGWVLPGGNQMLAVCGANVYSVTQDALGNLNAVSVGTLLTPIGPVQIRDNGYVAVIVDGAYGYTYLLNTGAFAQIVDPNFTGFASRVGMVDGWFIFNQANSRNFYLSPQYLGINGNVNQGLQNTKWDATQFAVADATGDLLVSLIEDQRLVWLPKERATEVWYDAGAQFFTFNRQQGVLLQIGCAAPQSVVRITKGLMWLAANERGQNFVIRTQGFDYDRVSTHAIDYALTSYSTVADAIGWAYIENGHEFYVLTLPTADVTWVYDTGTGLWHERLSFNPTLGTYHRHRGNFVVNFHNRRLIGTWDTGALAWMDRSLFLDGTNPLVSWRRTGHIWDKQSRRRVFHHQLQIEVAPGTGTITTVTATRITYGSTISQVFETAMTSPTWTTNMGTDSSHNAPVILSVSPTVDVVDRAFLASNFAGSAGDGNVYHYSVTTGALSSTTLQSAATTPYKNWQLWTDNWAAFWQRSDSTNHARPAFIMATTDGNNVLFTNGGENLSNLTDFVSNSSSSWPNSTFVFDFGKLLFNTSGFGSNDVLYEVYPCADFQHVIAITKNSVSNAFRWAIINCLHGSEAVTQTGTISDNASTLIAQTAAAGGSSSIADNNPTSGTAGVPGSLGCLQTDLQLLWIVFYHQDNGSPTKLAQLVILAINQSTLDLKIQAGLSGGQGTPAFPSTNAAGTANKAAALWADAGTCAILCGQDLTVWKLNGYGNVASSSLQSSPKMILRWSDDGGKMFGNEKLLPMGQIGQYKNRAIAYNLGYSRDRVYDLKIVDAFQRDIIGVTLMSETEQ